MTLTELYAIYQTHPVICTDTRKLTTGCLYFALKGDNFNGNFFAEKALNEGASFAVIDERQFKINNRYILVDDVLTMLQELATYHRKQLNIPIIGIVGSNGKTTTKELIGAVLTAKHKVLITPGNFNNHIGLPLTLLMLNQQHEMAVIEMGANHVGENEFLCRIALPSHGLVTNNGKDHLEGFGSLEGVEQSNNEMYVHLANNNGTAFVNANDNDLTRMARSVNKKETYAANFNLLTTIATYKGFASQLQPHIEFKLENYPLQGIKSNLSGDYNFDNIMAAVAIGLHFGLSITEIKTGIELYQPKNLRSQVIEKEHNKIFLDAYNANPSSMEVSIRNFAAMPGENKVLILGDMYELGSFEAQEHQAIADYCKTFSIPRVILIGSAFAKTTHGFEHFENTASLIAAIKNEPLKNQFIFIKGSRGMMLENLLDWM